MSRVARTGPDARLCGYGERRAGPRRRTRRHACAAPGIGALSNVVRASRSAGHPRSVGPSWRADTDRVMAVLPPLVARGARPQSPLKGSNIMASNQLHIGRAATGRRHSRSTRAASTSSTTPRSTAVRPSRSPSATTSGLHGLLPPAVETIEEQVDRSLRAVPRLRDRRRQVGLPHPAARQQRGAVLPARRRARARDAADRLHADGRYGDRGVQPPVPAAARCLPQHRRHRRHRRGAGRHRPRTRRHRPRRRVRRRGHPRHRRLGRRRHRHLDRQARRLHGRRRHRPRAGARGRPRRRHQPRGAAQRPALPRPAPLAGARREVRRVHRRLRRPRHQAVPERDPALGGLLRAHRPAASSTGTATRCAPSTTTSRAPPRSASPAPCPACGSRADGWSTSRSWSSAPARPASGSPT